MRVSKVTYSKVFFIKSGKLAGIAIVKFGEMIGIIRAKDILHIELIISRRKKR